MAFGIAALGALAIAGAGARLAATRR
jgi:hypothetical protein